MPTSKLRRTLRFESLEARLAMAFECGNTPFTSITIEQFLETLPPISKVSEEDYALFVERVKQEFPAIAADLDDGNGSGLEALLPEVQAAIDEYFARPPTAEGPELYELRFYNEGGRRLYLDELGRVLVEVRFDEGIQPWDHQAGERLQAVGFDAEPYQMGWIPLNRIDELRALDFVASVDIPAPLLVTKHLRPLGMATRTCYASPPGQFPSAMVWAEDHPTYLSLLHNDSTWSGPVRPWPADVPLPIFSPILTSPPSITLPSPPPIYGPQVPTYWTPPTPASHHPLIVYPVIEPEFVGPVQPAELLVPLFGNANEAAEAPAVRAAFLAAWETELKARLPQPIWAEQIAAGLNVAETQYAELNASINEHSAYYANSAFGQTLVKYQAEGLDERAGKVWRVTTSSLNMSILEAYLDGETLQLVFARILPEG